MIDISLILFRHWVGRKWNHILRYFVWITGNVAHSFHVQCNKINFPAAFDSNVCRAGVFDAGSEVLIQYHYPFRLQLGTLKMHGIEQSNLPNDTYHWLWPNRTITKSVPKSEGCTLKGFWTLLKYWVISNEWNINDIAFPLCVNTSPCAKPFL